MSAATVTTKGRITVPAKVRDALRIKTGDRIEFIQIEPGRVELLAVTQSVTGLKGLIRKPTAPVKIATMNNTIAAHGAKARCELDRRCIVLAGMTTPPLMSELSITTEWIPR